ncbi:glycosyltransferase family 4 protein [Methylobacter marinus]|jgi:glycosyltransferase involved in cell wall biosynthesis|uniref:glycosyltransferase family 4 protein n=1 Tax=Methylobacter marinus TaxID=34058 RepID=UPI0003766811|nr:glycosyltransferase family 4 protein [Methylobacter marinus]
MERIKILHLITHLGFGGGLDNTLLTVRDHSRDRFEVHLAAGTVEPGEDYSDWSERAREYADVLFIIPDLHRSVHLLNDLRAVRQIADLIRKEDYRIIHTHTTKAGILGRIAARRSGVPVVIHTYHAFAWQVAYVSQVSAWRHYLAGLKERLYVAVERYGATLSDALITVADMNKQEVITRKVAPPEKLSTIYSGIDLDRFRAKTHDRNELCRQFGLDPARPIVGMIGRLSIQKAPLDFVQAAKTALQSRPDAQFILVGDGPLAQAVQAAIGAEQRIRILGFREDVTEIFTVLDVFALSSLWEGLGRALTEAMIMNVPVTATRAGGIPELVIHGETGLLADPGDSAQLAWNIVWLLDHPDEARKMSERAMARVVPAFSGQHMVKQIEALYERVLLEKGALLSR